MCRVLYRIYMYCIYPGKAQGIKRVHGVVLLGVKGTSKLIR